MIRVGIRESKQRASELVRYVRETGNDGADNLLTVRV